MSTWINITDKDDIEYDHSEDTLDIYLGRDDFGNNYVTVPLEFIREILKDIP